MKSTIVPELSPASPVRVTHTTQYDKYKTHIIYGTSVNIPDSPYYSTLPETRHMRTS